jgi:hypothetical protein
VAVLLAVVCTSFASAATWYVHPDSALNTIQAALNAAAAGDTVLVAPGTYNENIVWPSRGGIKLLSEFGPEVTTIDGNDARVIRMAKYLSGTTVLDGFTIQHGAANPGDPNGGGVYCDSASPTIRNNIITQNSAYGNGAGIFGHFCASDVKDNAIELNSASGRGSGIYCYGEGQDSSNMTIIENRIAGNGVGGGIHCFYCQPGVSYNQVLDNTASDGGGFYFKDSASPPVSSEVHYNNIQGNRGYGIWADASSYVHAESNWWGHPAGPDSGDHTGGWWVYDDPWLNQRITFDLAADRVTSPPDTVLCDSTYVISIKVSNVSSLSYDATYFAASCAIGPAYEDYVRVDQLVHSGDSILVTFTPWTVPDADSTTVFVTAMVHYMIDDVPANDTVRKQVYAQRAGVGDRPADVPRSFSLRVDRSPFSRSLPIQYEIPTAGRVALVVQDAAGRLVATLAGGIQQRGAHSLTWNAAECAPGVYFVDLVTDSGRRCLKVLHTR